MWKEARQTPNLLPLSSFVVSGLEFVKVYPLGPGGRGWGFGDALYFALRFQHFSFYRFAADKRPFSTQILEALHLVLGLMVPLTFSALVLARAACR
jgi:hypothetical protein